MSLSRVGSSDSGSASSESTIEDVDLAAWNFGCPLERTPRYERSEAEAALLAEFLAPILYSNGSNSSSESVVSTTSSVYDNMYVFCSTFSHFGLTTPIPRDFDALIDELITREPLIAKPDSFVSINLACKLQWTINNYGSYLCCRRSWNRQQKMRMTP